MDKKEHLTHLYESLIMQGRIRNKKELAKAIGIGYHGLISAMNGNPQYLTDSLVAKVAAFAGNTETEQPLPPPPPQEQPDITIPAATAKMYADMAESIRILSEIVAGYQKGGTETGTGN